MRFTYTFCMAVFAFALNAQEIKPNVIHSSFTVSIDENTVVTNSTGDRVPYSEVMKILASGKYTIDLVNDVHGNATQCKLRAVSKADVDGKRETYLRTPGTENLPKPAAGTAMPRFQLGTLDGRKVITSEDIEGKVAVINFWYSNCKTCVNEINLLNKLANAYRNNVEVVFIAPTMDSRDTLNNFIPSHPFAYQICPLSTPLTDSLKIQTYPTHIVVGRDGKIYSSYAGGLPGIDDMLHSDIEAALKANLNLVKNQ